MVSDDSAEQPDERSSDWEPDSPTRVDDDTIVVPMRMYKSITVFSTLVAVVLVVSGFLLFDAATQTQNLLRQLVVGLFSAVGLAVPAGVLDVTFGLFGVAFILIGAGSYILGTRFKTVDMLSGDDEAVADDGEDDKASPSDSDEKA